MKDLKDLQMKPPIGLKNIQNNEEPKDIIPKIAIITSDITTHSKVEFPKMSGLYWSDPDSIAPVKLVRASMSVPFFFDPFEVGNLPNAGKKEVKNWKEYASYYGPVPPSAKFVDGGMLSNFPINVFHRQDGGIPRMPTFGVRINEKSQTM